MVSFRKSKRVSRFQSLLASNLRLSQLAMKNVARVQRTAISQGECRFFAAKLSWLDAERTGRLSVGVGRRHPVTMRKASLERCQ